MRILTILLLLTLISCTDKKTEIRVQKIDSLIGVIDSLNINLVKINIDSISHIYDNTNEIIKVYKKTTHRFKRNKLIKNMEYASAINKACRKFLSKYSSFQKELTYSKHQLEALRHDVDEKLLTDSLYNNYYLTEKSILEKLDSDFMQSEEWIDEKIELYKLVSGDMNQLKDTILSLQLKEK